MNRSVNDSVRIAARSFTFTDPIVEIGSLYMPGFEKLGDLRRHFPEHAYIGCDIRHGSGVDRIERAEHLSFADKSVGAVVLCEILEHLPDPARAVAEAHRVLRDDGLLVVSVPFQFRLHGFPTDYWRFTPSGVHVLLSAFPETIIFALGPRLKPSHVFAVAVKQPTHDFAVCKERFVAAIRSEFLRSRLRGHWSELKGRGRDFFGCLLGRAQLGVFFFDPSAPGAYASMTADSARQAPLSERRSP